MQKLPYKFIAASENLYKALDDLNIDVPYPIDNKKQKLIKLVKLTSFYLNDTDTSNVDIIQQAKEIMDIYYVKNAIFDNLKNIQELVAYKIDNGDLQITIASDDNYKNVIKNLYNANKKFD